MSENEMRINRFGFGESGDMDDLARTVEPTELAMVLKSIVRLVLAEETGLLETLTDEAQADFVVPLGMAGKMLSGSDYSVKELVAAACTVRYCAEPHIPGFPSELSRLVSQLPR
ncbi:hypothetical protein Ait01nite_024370 [Actinoplanes italicus]|uniref:Uncharacterized protein n=1 Tax=Actinoplanes italicus TaxID=113567 RepID=A0A2T0KG94_9ACTN|nr:hypothetical protein [Actinoplanes italicus]PRX22188.1 hypothetical protein CLV67_105365 [Actinoplanes italicus]GIE29392.1 hypothetical protein Ait01nite_024370 [Actinoplanes italicus]